MPDVEVISGQTMGTTYNVTCVLAGSVTLGDVRTTIKRALKRVNRSMSIFDCQSEISRFNAKRDTQPLLISKHFYKVLSQAALVASLSNGAWDGTLKPAVDLWGFGSKDKPKQKPSDQAIAESGRHVGFSKIQFYKTGRQSYISKKDPLVTLDLGSIAKGYGVDHVASVLRKLGLMRFIVEVGGEIYVSGEKTDGEPWVIGINSPEKSAAVTDVFVTLALKDQAIATSGDYRNWIDLNGESFSHTLDPRTLRPLQNNIVSVSVIAPTCTLADGLTTALIVLGPQVGATMIENMPEIKALIVTKENQTYTVHSSPSFKTHIV